MIGLVGATLMVAATTLDDAVWLVPYVSSTSLPVRTRMIHATLFIGTLVGLGLVCVVVAELISQQAVQWGNNEDIILGAVGAALCWMIAGAIYCKKMWKRRQRRLAAATLAAVDSQKKNVQSTSYQSIKTGNKNEDDVSCSSSDSSLSLEDQISLDPSPWAVISFTTLGALDEVSYFPALVIGKVFTPFELIIGTFLAACVILVIVTLLLAKCKPLIRWLDSIPLYGIVALFATVLTIGVLIDVFDGQDNDD